MLELQGDQPTKSLRQLKLMADQNLDASEANKNRLKKVHLPLISHTMMKGDVIAIQQLSRESVGRNALLLAIAIA